MALLDLVGELTGTLPGLSPILAQTYINRALKSVYDKVHALEWELRGRPGADDL